MSFKEVLQRSRGIFVGLFIGFLFNIIFYGFTTALLTIIFLTFGYLALVYLILLFK